MKPTSSVSILPIIATLWSAVYPASDRKSKYAPYCTRTFRSSALSSSRDAMINGVSRKTQLKPDGMICRSKRQASKQKIKQIFASEIKGKLWCWSVEPSRTFFAKIVNGIGNRTILGKLLFCHMAKYFRSRLCKTHQCRLSWRNSEV